MFEKRLKVLLLFLAFAVGIIVARLFDMQVLNAHAYRARAEQALVLPPKSLPAIRGRILDRNGQELVSDEPCWELRVHYDVLAMNTSGVKRWVDRCPDPTVGVAKPDRDASPAEKEQWFRERVADMWAELNRLGIDEPTAIRERVDATCARVRQIHDEVSERRGFDSPVREERMYHSVLPVLNDQQQVDARLHFAEFPWVAVEDATHRVYHAGPAWGHVLGRMGPVTADTRRNDPFRGDPAREYLGNERLGKIGVERLAEPLLRGSRGVVQRTLDGEVLEDQPAQPGRDVHLTIHAGLQDALYDLLAERIPPLPYSAGGTIVVLDVATRDCLALVSYPGFAPDELRRNYTRLRDDTRHQPLRFRAVANQYMPGSIVKPLVCLAGLDSGVITLDTRFDCQGYLFPNILNKWRCWPNRSGTRMRHGLLDATGGIKHSCNIFMYQTGERLGVEGLNGYFDMVGFGNVTSTGLIEEARGINPSAQLLLEKGQRPTPGYARLYSIGQAELSVTPIQAANLMAIYASGVRKHVNLVRERRDDISWTLPGSTAAWAAIRRGLYGVVNDADGTAHRTAYVAPDCGYALCGKTGSAEVGAGAIRYRIRYGESDALEQVVTVPATKLSEALEWFVERYPHEAVDPRDITVAERWPNRPPEHGRKHSHAWFAGYLAPLAANGQPDPRRTPPIAFSVLVEYGGSGGRVSGPIGQAVVHTLLEQLGPDLDPNHVASATQVADGAADGGATR
jgi:penicillin-binding protein 2